MLKSVSLDTAGLPLPTLPCPWCLKTAHRSWRPQAANGGTSIGWCGPPPSCALQKAPGPWLSPDWLWQGLEICTSDLRDSQAGPCGFTRSMPAHPSFLQGGGGQDSGQPTKEQSAAESSPAGGALLYPAVPGRACLHANWQKLCVCPRARDRPCWYLFLTSYMGLTTVGIRAWAEG